MHYNIQNDKGTERHASEETFNKKTKLARNNSTREVKYCFKLKAALQSKNCFSCSNG